MKFIMLLNYFFYLIDKVEVMIELVIIGDLLVDMYF